MKQKLKAFMSYTHLDDQNDGKRLTLFRECLAKEVRAQTGKEFLIFQDVEDIGWGQDFEKRIEDAIKEVTFFIPIITPSFFNSEYCREELRQFLKREEQLQRNDLILPVYYIACPILEDRSKQATDELAQIIAARQRVDWRNLRFASFKSQKVRRKLAAMAVQLRAAMERVQPSPASDAPRSTRERRASEGPSLSIPPSPRAVEKIKSVPVGEIVDFESELKLFHGMLADPSERRLMFIQAPGGRGKTCLLRLMRRYCEEQGVPFCWVDFRGESYDNPALTLAREICDQLGLVPWHLAEALLLLSAYGAKGEARAEIGGDVTDAQIFIQVLTKVSTTEEALRQDYIKQRLKRAFVADLADLAADKKAVVCFLDHFEDVSNEEESWLFEALLCPLRENELRRVIAVTTGRRWPKIEDWEWEGCAHLLGTLSSMTIDHVKEYAGRIGYDISDEVARLCWRACREGSIPLHMGAFVKNLKAVEVRP